MSVARSRLVVVGNGMAGARFVEDLVARDGRSRYDIVVFGDEPHGNYNRILLSGVLAGTHLPDDIMLNPTSWYAAHDVTLRAGVRIDRIETDVSAVVDQDGRVDRYDVLVLATGSRPLMPPIEGLNADRGGMREGVFVFRTIDDCARIAASARRSSTAAVIGGGLLGLEAARGLLTHGLSVTVVHLVGHVLDAQLDADAGRIVKRQLEDMGLRIRTSTATTAILGNGRVTGLRFADGSTLDCDMVVIAAGIRPNVELARAAGLEVRRGIVIGDDLAVPSAPNVYAIGECAEHRGQTYGLVAPLWEQARVLADRLTRTKPDALYVGSRTSTKLKVAGVTVAVMGAKEPTDDDDEVVSYAEPSRGIYKKLIVRGNRLLGAIVVGDGEVVPSLAQAFAEATPLCDTRSDLLFQAVSHAATSRPPADALPDTAQVCDCNAVSKAQIIDAVLGGARSVQAVCDRTRASTGCGSCRPEVERIVELACRGIDRQELFDAPPQGVDTFEPPAEAAAIVSLNKIERIKRDKDGLDILPDVPALASGPWQSIDEGDRERLKWAGVFFRRQTPGKFMMRVRMPNGISTAEQVRAVADISQEFGNGSVDITTRQQVQVRGFDISHVPAIWDRLERVGLTSLQTGMDNVRNVVGCAVAGLSTRELFDASPVVREYTELFLRHKAFTNLPRKFNVGISGCTEHCTHAESQDVALTPAILTEDGREVVGFNVAAGGKMGSGGCRMATPLDIFVDPSSAARLCAELTLLFRDHGSRATRTRARLAFLVEEWGAARMRRALQHRLGTPLARAGRDARIPGSADHIGVHRQKQDGLNYVGLLVSVGRISAASLRDVARVATMFGTGDVRFTTAQNVVIPNVPDERVAAMLSDPLLRVLPHDPHGAMRGLVACTGIDYCHFALIETKDIAVRTAEHLAFTLPSSRHVTMHWSGCPAGCGNHSTADIGLLGKNIRVNGTVVEAVDVFVGGRAGPSARAGTKILEDVPCDDLPAVLERMIPFISTRRSSTPLTSSARVSATAPPATVRDATA